MAEHWAGITVTSDEITMVRLVIDGENAEFQEDVTWSLQEGERPEAYKVILDRLTNHFRETGITKVAVKASSVNKGAVRLPHLLAAELRGVVLAASAQAGADVECKAKATLSRTFGQRKVDEYVGDDGFWDRNMLANLRKGSREAALQILSARKA